MRTQSELDRASSIFGIQDGDLIQNKEVKKVHIFMRTGPLLSKRRCNAQWAAKNHLKFAIIKGVEFKQD